MGKAAMLSVEEVGEKLTEAGRLELYYLLGKAQGKPGEFWGP